MFSAFWGVLVFFGVLIFASGGSARSPRFDLAFIGGGSAFIVILVVLAMLSMSHKDNPEHLGKGSGVNLSSKKPFTGHGGHSPQGPGASGPGASGAPDAPRDDLG